MRDGVVRNLAPDGKSSRVPRGRSSQPRLQPRRSENCPISKQGDNLSDLQITQTGGAETGGQLMITQTNVGNGH
jgi:hypothetical protein